MTYRIITIDIAHDYPWLNLDIGELVTHIRFSFPELEVRSFHQINPDEKMAESLTLRDGDIVVVHADSITSENGFKLIKNITQSGVNVKIIRFGYHVGLKRKDIISQLFVNVVGYDIAGVINVIAKIIGACNISTLPFSSLVSADFSTLPPFSIFNYPIRSSKGCLNQCAFCERWREGRLIRKCPEILKNEINMAKSTFGARALTFWDSMLNNSPEHLKNVCDIIKDAELPWRSNGMTIRELSRDSISYLAESRCYLASFGIESLSYGVDSGKRLKFEEVALVRDQLRNSGIMMLGFFIVGLKGDTYSRSMRTMELAIKLDLDITLFSPAVALPGTPLSQWVHRKGRFLIKHNSANLQTLEQVNFETDNFTCDERIKVLEEASIFTDRNRLTKRLLTEKLGGPVSPSSKDNINWHQHSQSN